jgi:2-polyprenyl-3-methyl-5-hydroxy-6-metoxy-1,4-benzoquinol methylase
MLADRQPQKIFGVDISPDRVNELQASFAESGIDHHFQAGNAESLSFIESEAVDFIICRDVIEHLQRPMECLREFKRVLRPEGSVLFQTPNNLIHDELSLNHHSSNLIYFMMIGRREHGKVTIPS